MAGSTSSGTIRRLRGVLMVALLALLLGVGGLFLFGRSGGVDAPPPAIGDSDSIAELLLASEGWEYEVSDEGRPVFRIRGERMISDSDNNVILEEVGLTLYREDGDSWDVQCSRGTYNTESREAILEGDVRILGSTGLTVFADGITVGRGGQLIRSTSAVRFQYQALYAGRADLLSINLRSGVYMLDGEVSVDSLPTAPDPTSLRSRRVVFEERRNLVRALGAVRLSHADSHLRAVRLSAQLSADRGEIEFVRARNVNATTTRIEPDGLTQTLALTGKALSIVMDTELDAVRDFELEGGPLQRQNALVSIEDSTGIVRQVEARYIVGRDMTPTVRRLAAYEPVSFREFFAFSRGSETAWACADRATVTLHDNRLVALGLDGNAELWREGVFVEGNKIDFDADRGSTTLEGVPARVLARRGELEAPSIVHIHYSGEIQGHGGIRGRMHRSEGALAGGEEGPIQVVAEEIVWSESPQALLLRGKVRIWQDEQLLIADEIQESVEEERLEARGGVRTVWTPRSEPEVSDPEQEAEGAPPTTTDEPIEVTAARAVYDRQAGLVTYTGASRATQGLRSIQAEVIELRLSESGGAEQIECRNNVVIRDPENQRTVKGDLAVYHPQTGEVRISGERVTLKGEDGTKMEGPVLIYEFDTGRARIESEDLLAIGSPLEDGS